MGFVVINEFIVGQLSNKCYLIVENKNAILIDAGLCYNQVKDYIEKNDINLLAVLLTHGHFDHAVDAYKFQNDGVPIYIHKNDADKLCSDFNLAKQFGFDFNNIIADVLLDDGVIHIENFCINVISTPGHSKGSCAYVYENHIFVGDTLFENGYGRYDLYDGDYNQLVQSVKKLQQYINKNYLLHYGH